MNQFRQGLVKKKYIAFARGKLKPPKGILSGYILDREARRFGEKPKKAKTFYRTLGIKPGYSILELEPFTGRTNQLRIQLAKIGNPILGERKYAFGKDFKVNFRRLALHASFISFIHPLNHQRLSFNLNLPKDMKAFLSQY
jgi:23S rRNA-/tRNA-specific pseudouridylate synthase